MPNRKLTIALVGNPNTGKSTLFNALTGLRQKVGNYPGVTVEKKLGSLETDGCQVTVIDLPGTYSLAARSPDEKVTLDVLLGRVADTPKPDLILNIVDASNLERNFFLTTQLVELGVPVVVVLNMMDVAKDQGISFDPALLSQKLGVPVLPIQANKKRGIDAILKEITKPHVCSTPLAQFPEGFQHAVRSFSYANELPGIENTAHRDILHQRLLIDVGGAVEQQFIAISPKKKELLQSTRARLALDGCAVPQIEAKVRYGFLREHIRPLIARDPAKRSSVTSKIDRIVTHPIWGTLIFLAIMFLIFQSIFTWAKPFMEWIDVGREWVSGLVSSRMNPGPLRSLIIDGIIKGVGSVVIFLPQIAILFIFLAILEDCGYMARAAFMMDKIMSRCGLSGKSFIPLLSSFACAIPGIMATRVIEDRRDRLATILVAPLMSCSARLPVYALLIGAFVRTDGALGSWLPGLVLFAMYLIGVIVAPVIAWLLKKKLLAGEKSIFMMELPLYRWPSLVMVLYRVWDRSLAFIIRAGTLILASMIVIWALLYFPATDSQGVSYETRISELEEQIEKLGDDKTKAEAKSKLEDKVNDLQRQWKRESYLGKFGRAIEPVFSPLGWDWRIGTAAMAAFPAREVMVGTMGLIFGVGETDTKDKEAISSLGNTLKEAKWEEGSGRAGQPLFNLPVALSVMVFFALCCQCVSTLVIIKRETNSWGWPIFTFIYMTVLAYVAAWLTYRIALWWV